MKSMIFCTGVGAGMLAASAAFSAQPEWRWQECPRFERADLSYNVIRQLISAGKCGGERQNGENDRKPQEPGEDERQNGENDCRPQEYERPMPSKKDFGGHATAVEDYRNREGGLRGNDGGND